MDHSRPRRTPIRRRAWWLAIAATAACHSARPAAPPRPVAMEVASADRIADSLSALLDSQSVKPHEVTGEALKIFGDSLGALSEEPVDAEPTWDIDVRSYETHERVTYFIDRYQHAARQTFAKW